MSTIGADGLVKRVHLVNVSVRVSGRTTKKSTPTTSTVGLRVEREYEVDEVVLNREQYARGNKLATALRGLADRHGTSVGAVPGYLLSEDALARFQSEYANVLATEVAEHNGEPNQTAVVEAELFTAPIGQLFGPGDIARILGHVGAELVRARDMLAVGDTAALTNWLKRGQRLSGLIPALNGNVVEAAIEALREAKNTVALRVRNGYADKDAYEATLGKPLEGDKLKDALACVEWDRAIESVDSALGWLEPTRNASVHSSGAAAL